MKKTKTYLLFACVLAAACMATLAIASGFPDVDENHPNKTAIDYFLNEGIFTGYPDGSFQPDRVLNRAEQLKVFMLFSGAEPTATLYKNCFPDVAEEWFARYVCFAKEQGVVEGYPDGTFRPAQEVNKVEALKMLGMLQEWETQQPEQNPFDDVPYGEWFAPYVEFAKTHNLLEETGTIYGPALGISRAGTAELMYRSLEVLESQQLNMTIESTEPAAGKAKVGSWYDAVFVLRDEAGDSVEDADLSIFRDVRHRAEEHDFIEGETEFAYEPLGNGTYQVQIASNLAGNNGIIFYDRENGSSSRQNFIFEPGDPADLKITSMQGPSGAGQYAGTRLYELAVTDEYGNRIEDVEWLGEATFGDLLITDNSDGTAGAILTSDGYGIANVSFSANVDGTILTASDDVEFLPVTLGNTNAYELADASINIPVYLNIPQVASKAGYLSLVLSIPAGLEYQQMTLSGAFDLEKTETFMEDGSVEILLEGELSDPDDVITDTIGDIVITGIEEGEHEIRGTITLESEDPGFGETLLRPGGNVQANESGLYTPLSRPLAAINGKSEKRICMDVFIQPGTNITTAQVESDIRQAEDIYYENAQNCNCPHYLRIDFAVMTLSQQDWNTATGGNGVLGTSDTTDWFRSGNPIPPRPWCTKVIYMNKEGTEAGASIRNSDTDDIGRVSNFITIDNSHDTDGRTLAH
ncbi:MAG TPA: S-layer homology domain-containing protein, partial [Candidatus Gracilibacteria bacterium]|nr:S-layer homology domain-containing protein [Candidatus Gracilibacteria bacterium]